MNVDLKLEERGHVHRLMLNPIEALVTHQQGIHTLIRRTVARPESQQARSLECGFRNRTRLRATITNPRDCVGEELGDVRPDLGDDRGRLP
jgi:hypothetical protein